MTLTVESGLRSAKLRASESVKTYDDGNRLYGRLLEAYRGDAPRGLALAHLVNVNPLLEPIPPVLRDRRRGFMKATVTMSIEAGVGWEELDDTTTCAYVWGRDINSDSLNLYTTNQSIFSSADRDFWSTSYLKHRVSDPVFSFLWNIRDTSQSTVFDSIIYRVSTLRKNVLGFPILMLKKIVLYDCQFVVELAKAAGTLSSTGFGLQPVLGMSAMQQVF